MRAALSTVAAFVILLVSAGSAAGDGQQVIVVHVKLCTPAEVKGAVNRFVNAFNASDHRRLDRAFASEPDFQWYSTDAPGRRVLPAAADRARLVRYFAARHARGERLSITSIRVNANTIATGSLKSYGNFEVTLVREARDLVPTDYLGKGALHCYASRTDQLIVWSMARGG
jgi:hypothetical protein